MFKVTMFLLIILPSCLPAFLPVTLYMFVVDADLLSVMNLLFSQIYDICSEHPRVNGPISELMSPLDDVILDFMTEQDIPGASIALSKAGKLLYCQGDVI